MKVNRASTKRPAPKAALARPGYRRANPGVPRRLLKRSQRQRLIDAMVELSAQRGYNAVSVTELCSHAGVSPVTFYQYFEGKEPCFLAAYAACSEQVFGRMRSLAAEGPDLWQAAPVALGELLRSLQSDPEAG